MADRDYKLPSGGRKRARGAALPAVNEKNTFYPKELFLPIESFDERVRQYVGGDQDGLDAETLAVKESYAPEFNRNLMGRDPRDPEVQKEAGKAVVAIICKKATRRVQNAIKVLVNGSGEAIDFGPALPKGEMACAETSEKTILTLPGFLELKLLLMAGGAEAVRTADYLLEPIRPAGVKRAQSMEASQSLDFEGFEF